MSKVFSAFNLALAYGYDVMSQLLRACMPCYCRHCGSGLSNLTTTSSPSISSRNTQHTSRIHTSVLSLSTRVMLLPEQTASIRYKIVVNSLPKCFIVTSFHRQYFSYTRFRLLLLLFILFLCFSYYKYFARKFQMFIMLCNTSISLKRYALRSFVLRGDICLLVT